MTDFADLIKLVPIPDCNCVKLCSNLQLSRWFKYIDRKTEYVDEEYPGYPDADPITVQKKYFNIESETKKFIRANVNNQENPFDSSLTHKCMVDIAAYF